MTVSPHVDDYRGIIDNIVMQILQISFSESKFSGPSQHFSLIFEMNGFKFAMHVEDCLDL